MAIKKITNLPAKILFSQWAEYALPYHKLARHVPLSKYVSLEFFCALTKKKTKDAITLIRNSNSIHAVENESNELFIHPDGVFKHVIRSAKIKLNKLLIKKAA